MANPNVTINVFANTSEANRALTKVGSNVRGLGSETKKGQAGFGALGGAMKKAAVAAGGLIAAYAGLRAAMRGMQQLVAVNATYEDTMASVRAVTEQAPGFTEEAFGKMQDEARRLGATTRFSASQAAEGLKFLGMAGFSAEQATASLESTLKLAQAGNLELGESADIVSNILTAFGATAEQTGEYANVLAVTAARSNTDVRQLGEAMKYVGPIAGGLGMSVQDVSAAMGTLGSAGVQASMAGTSLRGVMIQLADTNSKAHKSLLAMGLTAEQIDPKLNSVEQLMRNMKNAGVNAANAYSMFGARAGVAADILTANIDKLAEMTSITNGSEGALDQMADTMDNTFKGSVLRMKSAWEEFLLTLGESGIMDGLRGMVDRVSGAIAHLTQAVHVVRNAFQSGTLGQLFFSTLKLGGALAINYIVGGLILGFRIAVTYFIGYLKTVTDPAFWEGVFNAFAALGFFLRGGIAKAMAELIAGTQDFLTPMMSGLVFIADKFRAALTVAGTTVVDIMLAGVEMVLTKLNQVSSIFGIDLDGAIEKVKSAREGVQGTREEAKELFQKSFADTKAEVGAVIEELPGALHEVGDELMVQGKEAFQNAASTVPGILNENIAQPIAEEVANFKPASVFDTSGLETELAGVIAENLPDDKKADKDGSGALVKPGQGAGGDVGGEGKKTASIGGAALGALNTILGKSANEIIAREAERQTKAQADTNQKLDDQTKVMEEIRDKPGVGTFT